MYLEVRNSKTFYSTGTGHINAEQPSVVFLHGAGMDHSVWVLPARYFARHGYNVYALDLPAHGRSAGSPLSSIDSMADWVSDAMDALMKAHEAITSALLQEYPDLDKETSFVAFDPTKYTLQ